MKVPNELVSRAKNELIVNEVTPIPETCADCPVATERQSLAIQLQQITEYIFQLATEETTPKQLSEILDLNEDLANTFRELLHEFFSGIDAPNRSNLDNLRHVNETGFTTIEYLIRHANRKIQGYENLVKNCADQGLRKVVLDRTGDKKPVELSMCSGEIDGVNSSKNKGVIKVFSINTLAVESESDDQPTT